MWTNDDLEKLHNLGLISIVGQIDQVKSASESGKRANEATRDPGWYAEQASRLRDELAYRQVQFREYQKAFEEAQSLRETKGEINLIDEDFAITPEAGMERMPFNGYFFRILTSQGPHAAGGAKNYIIDGKMTVGFAFVAYPAEYRATGVMTFIVDESGTVFEKDLGSDTTRLAETVTAYDPDSTWHQAEQTPKGSF